MNSKMPHRMGEFALIAKLFAPLSRKAPGAFALTDDAATLELPEGRELVITADALVEGVHFLRDDPPDLVARQALRVNVSDLVAKGAKPEAYLLALCLPPWVGDSWLETFASGLAQDQDAFSIFLHGGDTTATPGPLTLAITALGSIPHGRMLRRSGAKIGDSVFVSGTIGDASAGLALLRGEGAGLGTAEREFLVARYRVPEPRVALGQRLLGLATASLDVSDGLLADLGHVAETSGVRIVADATRVPLSPALRASWGSEIPAIIRAATSGDDYEIAFTAPSEARDSLAAAAKEAAIEIHEIGRVEAGTGVVLVDGKGKPIHLPRLGFTHF